MRSLTELYRIGLGPSSSHTMGPHRAAEIFLERHAKAEAFEVTLYDSLAATGKGHLTDIAIHEAFAARKVEVIWKPTQQLPLHPNGMEFVAIYPDTTRSEVWQVYSVGGGAIADAESFSPPSIYQLTTMTDILNHVSSTGQALWEYVEEVEGQELWDFLDDIWETMQRTMQRGLRAEGVLPGGLGVPRKACAFQRRAMDASGHLRRHGLISAYALATNEENAAGHEVVTAPTCGGSGTLPAVLRYTMETFDTPRESVLRALATAGLIGNLIKNNASISGAQVGCQGEVGAACSMAAAAATQLMGGTPRQVEYAAAMGLEHHLGLTCDPVAGLVQIPCIERNAFAANRAIDCADYSLFTDGSHLIPFDEVVQVMLETGNNLPSLYRETALGGLAAAYRARTNPGGTSK